jgi:hypothetical protein
MACGTAMPVPQAGTRSAVEVILHRLGGRKCQLLRRGDLDGRTRRGIAAVTFRARLDLELAKTAEGNFVTACGSVGNRRSDAIDDLAGISLGQAIGFGNLLGEFGIVHGKSSLC